MAWAERLPSGKYRGVYRDASGRRRSAGTWDHKPRAVREAAACELEARRRMSADPDGYKRPWGEWVEEWWPTRTVEASTLRGDKGRLERHLKPRWKDTPIGGVTRQDVKAWAARMLRDGTGPTTVQRCVHLLSASLVAAIDAEIIGANPAARIKLPKSSQAMERYLTHEEYDAVYDQMSTTLEQLVLEVLARTGMRPAEAAGLHWNRVDLENRRIRIVETYDQEVGTVKGYTKSRRARTVPISTALTARLETERDARLAAGENLKGGCGCVHTTTRAPCRSTLVLRSPSGRPLRESNFDRRVFKPALDRAEVGHARLYDLRHTFASWLLQRGIPLAEVGQLLGHTSSQTTQIYAHLAREPHPAVLAAIEAAQRGEDA